MSAGGSICPDFEECQFFINFTLEFKIKSDILMKNFFIAFTLVVAFVSCQKIDLTEIVSETAVVEASAIEEEETFTRKYAAVLSQPELHPSAVRYWGNIRKVVEETVRLENIFNIDLSSWNPIMMDIETVKIKVEGKYVKFNELRSADKMSFISRYCETEAGFLSWKINKIAPEMAGYMDALSAIMEETIIKVLDGSLCTFSNPVAAVEGVIKAFEKYNIRAVDLSRNDDIFSWIHIASEEYCGGVPMMEAFDRMVSVAKRGDIIIGASSIDHPTTVINFENNGGYKLGHCEMFVKDIVEEDRERIYEPWFHPLFGAMDGAPSYQPLTNFECNSFILRIFVKEYERQNDGSFTVGEFRIDPETFLKEAFSHEGKRFKSLRNVDDILFTRSVTPECFTCSSLIWYCAHEAYGIDVANMLSPVIAPSSIIMDDNIWILAKIGGTPIEYD